MRVLLVEDSVSLQAWISRGLREAGYAVDVIGDGRKAVVFGLTTEYDVIVLDLMLPTLDGLSALRELRERGNRSCVLILTVRDTVDERVRGLHAGADDYLVKPFAFSELMARIQTLARRVHGIVRPVVRVGPLEVDTSSRTVRVLGVQARYLALSPREYALLEYLAHRAGQAVSRGELEEHLYDDRSQLQSNVVDATICALRAKLDSSGCPSIIHTRRKFGYILAEQACP